MTELHIWGELDDLPSIDPECIAVLAHLIHLDEIENISVISSFDASTSQNGDLPALVSEGPIRAGYSSIAHQFGSAKTSKASPNTIADIEAWSTFIQSRGQALLDLYLYVSSTNYWNATSPAFTKILPWYSNYIVPPARRAAAIARTKHLGVRSLDLDSIDEYAAGDDVRVAGQPTSAKSFTTTTNPEELIKKQKSAKWLQTQQHSDTFQLFQLTKAFFGPLEELLGDKDYLLTDDDPTSLDCVAVGFLSLIRYASVPQPWLAEALRTRFPKLHAYTGRLYQQTFLNPQKPWRSRLSKAAPPTAGQSAVAMGRSILDWALPSLRQTTTLDSSIECRNFEKPAPSSTPISLSSLLSPTVLLPIGAIAGLAFGVVRYISVSSEEHHGEKTFRAQEHDFFTPSTLADLGESGAMLSALRTAFDQETQGRSDKAPVVEVDIDVENAEGEVKRDVVYKR